MGGGEAELSLLRPIAVKDGDRLKKAVTVSVSDCVSLGTSDLEHRRLPSIRWKKSEVPGGALSVPLGYPVLPG